MAKKKTPSGGPKRKLAQVDRELLKLLAERRRLAADEGGPAERSPSERLAAEDAAIEALAEKAAKLPAEYVRDVFREVMAGCRVGPSGVRIAYLGPEQTFSHQAAIRRFGAAADLTPVGSIAAVFEEVDRGTSDFGVVPLENSTDGRVTDTLDCFAKTRVTVCGELPLRIHHCLLGSGPRAKLTTVCSKPQALSQCRNWLAQHLPGAETRPVASTAEAAKMAKADPTVGAIASASAAGPLGLKILSENIEDQPDNITRFAVIGGETPAKTGRDKTSAWFEVPHEPGALADAMAIFKRQKLNLTWIESFPIPGSGGRYLFFVEFLGHQAEVRVRRALESLAKKATQLEVLGSYPQAEPID